MATSITLEQSLASVVRYIQDNAEDGTKLYFDEIPEDYYVPSIYFPIPTTTSRKVTFTSYLVTLTVDIWFMAKKDWDANAAAVAMRDCILCDGLRIPYYDSDGNDISRHMHVTEPEIKRIDEGITQLQFDVKDYFAPAAQETAQVQKVYLSWGSAAASESEDESTETDEDETEEDETDETESEEEQEG